MTRTTFAIFFVLFSTIVCLAACQTDCPPCECDGNDYASKLKKLQENHEKLERELQKEVSAVHKQLDKINDGLDDDNELSKIGYDRYRNCKFHYEYAFENDDPEKAIYWRQRWEKTWSKECINIYPPPSKSGPPSR